MKTTEKILIAISDIHGEYDLTYNLLTQIHQKYDIFEGPFKIRDNISFHANGDYIDRGLQSEECLNYIIALTERSEKATAILGNHELTALMIPPTPELTLTKNQKLWLCQRKPYEQISIFGKKIVFTHSDIHQNFGLETYLNRVEDGYNILIDQIKGNNEERKKSHFVPTFVSRNYSESFEPEEIDEIINKLGFDYHIVGHSPSVDGIRKISNRVVNIDASLFETKRPEALIIKPDGMYRFTPTEEIQIEEF